MTPDSVFDALATDYDDLSAHWYSWLFARLHLLIASEVMQVYKPRRVLDVGCGTGYQSFLHAASGAEVVGIDLNRRMLHLASLKATCHRSGYTHQFPAYHGYVHRYQRMIQAVVAQSQIAPVTKPVFIQADARALPCSSSSFDHVNCCGSTMSFLADHTLALQEMARILRPNGTVLIEVESRWCGDTLWVGLDSMCGRQLFHMQAKEALHLFSAPLRGHVDTVYAFGEQQIPMRLRLFALDLLQREIAACGLRLVASWPIHSITNCIPSPLLHEYQANVTNRVFPLLAMIEERMPPIWNGSSTVLLLQKH